MNFFNIVRKKGRIIVMVNVAVMLLVMAVFYTINQIEHYTDAFQDYYEVKSVQDFMYCSTNNRYVKLNFTDVYQTGYSFTENDRITAYYIDFDIDGYGVIGVVNKKESEDIFDGTQDYVYGKVKIFSGIDKDAMENIIADYVDEYKDKYSEAQIRDMYLPFQLDNYHGHKDGDYFIMILFALVCLINLVCILKGLIMLAIPGKYLSGKRHNRFMENDYEEVIYKYKNRGLIFTNEYLIRETLTSYKIYDMEDILWVYPRNIWYVRGTYVGTVIKTKRKETIYVHYQNDAIYMLLKEKNPLVFYGDTQENRMRYREIVSDNRY